MPPLSTKYKLIVVVTLIMLIFAVDQTTKNWAIEVLRGHVPRLYLNGFFQFVYAENPGAFLGLGDSWSREARFIIFGLVVLAGLAAMLYYLFFRTKTWINFIAYSLILAGGFGNLWDRMFREHGHVVDFMLFDIWGPIRTGVVNVADMVIVAGVLLAFYAEYASKKQFQNPV